MAIFYGRAVRVTAVVNPKEKENQIMVKEFLSVSLVTLAAIGMAGCGDTRTDRALSGAGLGAAAGTGAAVLTGGNAATGALIGGAAGAAAGGLTDKDDVNFGKPIWRK